VQGLGRLNDPARFPAWVFGILYRKSADGLRRAVKARDRITEADPDTEQSMRASPETRLSLDQAMAQLTPDHRATALLFFGEGLTLPEISLAMSVPVGTVKSRLFHARKQLRSCLSPTQL
jgi:RNA polymerase sigma factor (sigma-70 family)